MSYARRAALGADLGWDQYQATAVAEANRSAAKFVIAEVSRDGMTAMAIPYATRSAMLAAWDRLSLDATIAFAIAYDKTEAADARVVEQKINPSIENVVIRRTDWRSIAPWAFGAVAVIAAAVYVSSAKTMASRRRFR